MKRNKKSQGTMVMFLETDLQQSLPFDQSILTPIQQQVFKQLSAVEQEKIRAGYGTVVARLENRETICEFNMENYHPPKSAIESLARMLLPQMREYFSNEKNRHKFEEEHSADE